MTGNPDPLNPTGPPIVPFHKTTYCESTDLNHSWNGTHQEWDNGAMDGFTAANGSSSANADPSDPSGARDDGLLRPDRSAVLLRAVQHVRDERPLLLVGAVADVPEPPVSVRGNVVRSHPQRRRSTAHAEVGVRAARCQAS